MSNQTSTHIPSDFLNTNAAEQYENAENATRHFAKIIVQSSSIGESIRSGEQVHVLDCACGPGAVVQEVYDPVAREKWGQLKVTGTDFSPGMLDYLGKRGERRGWTGLDTKTVDGKAYTSQRLQQAGSLRNSVLVEKKKVSVGKPDTFVVSMQFALGVVARKWWKEEDNAKKLQELRNTVEKVDAEDVGHRGVVQLEFDGIVGLGWKSQ